MCPTGIQIQNQDIRPDIMLGKCLFHRLSNGLFYMTALQAIGDKAWPGSAQAETVTNDYGETQFKCYIPEGATGIILSNGNGAQTEDITDFSHAGYWMDGTQNDQGHYIVTAWD